MLPIKGLELFVTVGSHLIQASVMTNFLIVDIPLVYNAIIKYPIMNAFE